MKALARVGLELAGSSWPPAWKEIGGDERNRRVPSRTNGPGDGPLGNVNDAHDDRGLSRPFVAAAGVVDRPAVGADPAQAGRSRVALADRVRGDQAEESPGSQQVERPAEEVGHEVGVAVRFLVDRLQPVEVAVAVAIDERVLARERRIADDRIEAAGFFAGRTPPGNSISQWNGMNRTGRRRAVPPLPRRAARGLRSSSGPRYDSS